METFEKLKDRLNDALGQIESSLKNSENDNSLENLISENSGLQRQIDLLKIELENLNKNERQPLGTVELEDLRAKLAKMNEEREEEKKELQSLYDQLSSALAGSGETV
jgi:predicted  nucleic acid-binding Zn-ribbon protein